MIFFLTTFNKIHKLFVILENHYIFSLSNNYSKKPSGLEDLTVKF
jgi:hypothetical protein